MAALMRVCVFVRVSVSVRVRVRVSVRVRMRVRMSVCVRVRVRACELVTNYDPVDCIKELQSIERKTLFRSTWP